MNSINKQSSSSSLPRWLWLHMTAFLVVCGIAIQIFSGSIAYAAPIKANQPATDPQVIIAIDTTSPSCVVTKTVTNPKTNKQISVAHQQCDPGTSIDTQTVSLSYAKAQGDAYVLPLPANASLSKQLQWTNQIEQLMAEKQKALRPVTVHPDSCTDGGQRITLYTGYQTKNLDTVEGTVTYNVAADCSNIFIDTTYLYVSIVPLNNPEFWIGWRYASMQPQDCGSFPVYELVPNQSNPAHWSPNQTQPRGYYGLWDIDSGDVCIGNGGRIATLSSGSVLN